MNGTTEIDQLFQGAVRRNDIPGLVAAVASKNEILYYKAFGKMDVANNIEMQKDAIFIIRSLTKPITSVAVMMLYEEEKLELDDPISKYIPSLKNPEVITQFNETDATYITKPAEHKITVRHLLTHTSGFGYGWSDPILHRLEEKTGKISRELPLLHEPGIRWTYGMGTRVLGEMIEEITDMPLDEFIQVRILGPLGMEDTFYRIPQEKLDRWVTLHQRIDGMLVEQPKPDEHHPLIFGDTGLFSTAKEYITFLQMLLNGGTLDSTKILSERSIGLMTQNQIGELVVEEQPAANSALSRIYPLGTGRDKFGLGFQITTTNEANANLRSPGSYSWSGLHNTHFWVDPAKEIAAVIFMHVLPFYDEACIRIYQRFEELVYKNLI